jgi:uncharacterized protein (DUF2062 family)
MTRHAALGAAAREAGKATHFVSGNLRGGAPAAGALKPRATAPRFRRLSWYVRRKLVVPFLRRKHSPEYSARGVSLGLLIGMTPTLGLHLLIVVAAWAIVHKLFPLRRFSLLVAMAWTCVMNPLTAAPLYYVFLVTGRVMLGGGDSVNAYGTFREQFDTALAAGNGWLETAWSLIGNGFDRFWLPMLVGCIPWAILAAFIGYRWSLWFVRARRRRRTQRSAKKASSASTVVSGSGRRV